MKKACRLLTVFMLSFYLGLYNGYIALWNSEEPQPVQVFPYRADAYPKIDQSALGRGIPITSQEDLTQLLEDYLS